MNHNIKIKQKKALSPIRNGYKFDHPNSCHVMTRPKVQNNRSKLFLLYLILISKLDLTPLIIGSETNFKRLTIHQFMKFYPWGSYI